VVVGWIIFRSESISQAWEYICGMWQWETLRASYRFFIQHGIRSISFWVVVMLVVEWFERKEEHGLSLNKVHVTFMRILIYLFFLFIIYLYAPATSGEFIYFQF